MQLHSSTLFYFCAGGDFGTSQFHIQASQIMEKISQGIPWDRCVGSKGFFFFLHCFDWVYSVYSMHWTIGLGYNELM